MYHQLFIAVVVMTLLTLASYKVGERFWTQRPSWDTRLLLATVSLAFVFASGCLGHLVWAERLPFSAALYWANLTPLLLGFASGLAGHAVGLRPRSRPIIASTLMTLAIGFLITPMVRPLLFPLNLSVGSRWADDVCLQSHPASCAPAAAVTLLSQHGIDASERDLAEACLTSAMGTEALGLYRGLCDAAAAEGLQAVVAASDPNEWLAAGQLPNAALVQFQILAGDPYSNFFGRSNEGHVVVVLGRTDDGRWIVGDPAIGRITWSDAQLRQYFTGDAIYLRPTSSR